MGKPMREFVDPQFRSEFDAYLREIERTGEARGLLAVVTRSGDRRVWEYHNTLRTEGVPRPIVRGIAHDVTERMRAEKSLRASNEELVNTARERERTIRDLTLFRTLLDQSNDAIKVIDPETLRFLDVNEKAYTELGYTREELLSKTVYDVDPNADESLVQRARQQLQDSGFAIMETVHLRKDGTTFPVEVNMRLVRLDREYAVSISRDITERKRAEERLREFERVVENLEEMIVVIDRERRYVLANRARLRFRGTTKDQVVGRFLPDVVGTEFYETVIKAKLDECFEGKVVSFELRRVYPEIGERDLSITYLPVEGASGIDRVACVMCDITERKRADEALRNSETRFRAVYERSPLGIALVDSRTGRILQVNPKYCEIAGRSEAELLAIDVRSITHPDDIGLTNEYLQQLAEEKATSYETEKRYIRPDGSVRWVRILVVPMWGEGETHRYQMGLVQDATEQKRDEQIRSRLNRELRAISNCNETMLRAVDEQTLLDDVCHIVCDEAGYRMAWVGYAQHDAAKTVRPVAWAGVEDGYLATADVSWDDTERGRGPGGSAIRSGASVYVQDFAAAPIAAPWREDALRRGYRSSLGVPLKDEHDKTFGELGIYSAEPNAFTPEEIRLMEELAANLAFGITVMRARVERKQAEEAIARLVHELSEAKKKLTEEKIYLEQEIDTELGFGEIIGESKALQSVMEQVGKVASSDATVLILGETGTGKELVARAVHRLSRRAGKSFIKMNCAAIPSGLLESELFGNEKGAFTGAVNKKIGRLELADKGTLFLDEIGEISLALQPKLLRVLQDQEFERLGATQTLKVDFRLIAATNRDLADSVRESEFRSDLYYRLNVFPIRVPPLRQRRDDIPLLVEHFVQKFARRMNKSISSIPKKTLDGLMEWHWPGNVRELENFIERSVILTQGSVLVAPLGELVPFTTEETSVDESLEMAEREHILRALRDSHGQIGGPRGAATRLGLKRTTLQSKLKHLGINPRSGAQ